MWIVVVMIAAVVLWLALRTSAKKQKTAKQSGSAPSSQVTPRPLADVRAVPQPSADFAHDTRRFGEVLLGVDLRHRRR